MTHCAGCDQQLTLPYFRRQELLISDTSDIINIITYSVCQSCQSLLATDVPHSEAYWALRSRIELELIARDLMPSTSMELKGTHVTQVAERTETIRIYPSED